MDYTLPSLPPSEERLLDADALAERWGCHPKTAVRNAKKLGACPLRFNSRTLRFRLSDIMKVEEEALA
jgi:hypothetical protein